MPMNSNSLDIFDIITRSWFVRALGKPTAVQEEAWPAIAAGSHTLVSAPTGTGKTLSAFLVFIDRLKAEARAGTLSKELHLIYVSPLKSLAGDIRENLRKPLNGILEEERNYNPNLKSTPFDINIGIRTGDTPQNERKKMIKNPPHILITTPESLYLMLTSMSGQKILRSAKAIIIDELHAMIDSKRGAHLMLSIARLDKLCSQPLQRIGLSATIEPLSKAAEYLSPDPVTIVAPKMHKEVELAITSPLPESKIMHKDSVWKELAYTVYSHCTGTRSVIAFVEGRAYAEKLAYYVNQLGGENFARTHHGSLSKEHRLEVEEALRRGELRLLCATSSMELGIDVGEIDQVFQIGCPRSISSTMQRLGRAGHNPGRTSVMHIFPRVASECLYSGLTAEVVRKGGVEYSRPPRLCLDVLAQHLVSMATGEGYDIDEVMEILPRAYPFYEVTREDVKDVLCMLAGDYEHERDIPVRPRILYDRIHERVEGDPYSRMLAVSAGGTIPDKGLFAVRTENGVKVGEVDEEFVFEARVGDKFLLGSFSWQIQQIQKDTVLVSQSSIQGARPPFWKGEIKGRTIQTGMEFGRLIRKLSVAIETNTIDKELTSMGLDYSATTNAADFLRRQLEATGVLPDDKTIVIEHFHDETGSNQVMVHSIFGRQVNEPLAILSHEIVRRRTKTSFSYFVDDDGFLLFPYGDCEMPEGILFSINPDTAKSVLEAVLPATSLFNMTFRYNAGRALMMGVKKAGRQPLWVQRLRSTQMLDSVLKYREHPLIRETKRECLEDYWDLEGVVFLLHEIRSGNIQVREIYLDTPSPMAFPLRHQTEAYMMYEYTPTTSGIHHATEEALNQINYIEPAPEQLAKVSERARLPEDEKQLHSLLMIEGDLIAGEIDVPIDWLETLAEREQVCYIEPGLWIAAEQQDEYQKALQEEVPEARLRIVRRLLRYRGAYSVELLAERYFWSEDLARNVLAQLCEQGLAVENNGLYYHAELYDRARNETVKIRRTQIKTVPSERYAALIANRMRITAPQKEQLEYGIKNLCDQIYPVQQWEAILLPARVNGYRPELLDTLLSEGNYYWQIHSDKGLSFHLYDEIDWESDLSDIMLGLEENEKIIYDALLKRGASFVQRLSSLIEGESPYDTLIEMVEKGLIFADSFLPIRQLLSREKLQKTTVRQRISARSKVLANGRFELSRPRIELTMEQKLNRIFDRVIILSRETAQGINWSKALELLRVWEYTGRVRRGYFIKGLSGVQYIRAEEFDSTILALEQPNKDIIWLPAVDPAQQWGKALPHMQDRSFFNIPGNVVALRAGIPVAVFERQGKVLRVFDEEALHEALPIFAQDFARKRIFASQKRLIVKEYPEMAMNVLASAGFIREMQDYVLYK